MYLKEFSVPRSCVRHFWMLVVSNRSVDARPGSSILPGQPMLSREIIYQQIWVTRNCAFDALSGFERRGSGFHQPQVPRMFNHPCEVIGEDIQPHLSGDLQGPSSGMGRTHTVFDSAEGMLHPSRRVRMASGLGSSYVCTSSTTCSCFQRVMWRSFDEVSCPLIAQPWHAAAGQ